MIFAFVDESGHPHPKDSSTRPVLAAACFDARDLRALNTELFHLKRQLLGKEQFEVEAKANQLLTRSTFRNRPEKREFVEAFFDMCRNFPFKLFAVVMERPLTPPPIDRDILPMPFRYILYRVNRYVELEEPDDLGVVLFDGDGTQFNRLSERASNWLFKSQGGQSLSHLAESPFFVNSEFTPGIQIADMAAGVIRIYQENTLHRHIPSGDPFLSAISRYYKILEQKTVDLPRPVGTGIWYGIYFMSERMHHVLESDIGVEEVDHARPAADSNTESQM
ncbi:MAG: DUF3800 domain-containing protein [Dehalococcoidia bacterium]|nr:DUF3800 domain-containing protein [Dehalococcoidia bacterium]